MHDACAFISSLISSYLPIVLLFYSVVLINFFGIKICRALINLYHVFVNRDFISLVSAYVILKLKFSTSVTSSYSRRNGGKWILNNL